jgi:hypothetical protein
LSLEGVDESSWVPRLRLRDAGLEGGTGGYASFASGATLREPAPSGWVKREVISSIWATKELVMLSEVKRELGTSN